MDRADKIFTILVMAGLVALLVNHHRRKPMAVYESAAPSLQKGPAYLLSALPISRRFDDYADPVSYFQAGTDMSNAWGDGKTGDAQ